MFFFTTPFECESNLIQRKKDVTSINFRYSHLFRRSESRVTVYKKKTVRNCPIKKFNSYLQQFMILFLYSVINKMLFKHKMKKKSFTNWRLSSVINSLSLSLQFKGMVASFCDVTSDPFQFNFISLNCVD